MQRARPCVRGELVWFRGGGTVRLGVRGGAVIVEEINAHINIEDGEDHERCKEEIDTITHSSEHLRCETGNEEAARCKISWPYRNKLRKYETYAKSQFDAAMQDEVNVLTC